MSKYELIIFGASGFTGEFVVEEVAKVAGDKRWAIAGRSESKLRATLQKISNITGKDLNSIPVIIAEVDDVASLQKMAKQAKVVLNCVGPYRFYGEPVVKACVENGASHVDISGEPQFLESMQLKYNEEAKAKGAFIVGACGWDSIPCEIGLNFVREKMNGDVNGAETFVEFASRGAGIHFGTFQSMIHGFAHRDELKPIRRQLFPSPLPRTPFRMPSRKPLFFSDAVHGWCMPFLGSDKSVVTRSQQFNHQNRKWRPMAVQTYMKLQSLVEAIALIVWGMLFAVLASFEFGRKAMEKYPRVFSFGMFSHEGPSREQLAEVKFTYWFFANGWSERLSDADQQHTSKPDRELVCRVDGPDPGYGATSACLVASALTILEEHSKMPGRGGVLPPGAAFAETSIISRLNARGVKFTLVEGPAPPKN